MERIINLKFLQFSLKTYLFDLLIVLFIYFIPAISHLLAFPFYYLDPMRIAIVFGLILTSKKNTFILAITLPIFSIIISNHPQFFKALLIATELIINVGLFLLLIKKIPNLFISFFISVLISKIFYYLLKFSFINFGLIDSNLFSTPLYYQIIIAFALSGIVYWFFNNRTTEKIDLK